MCGYLQVEHRVNVSLSAVSAGLAGENNNFFLRPLLEPCQNGHGSALEASRFELSLVPGAKFLLNEKVSA